MNRRQFGSLCATLSAAPFLSRALGAKPASILDAADHLGTLFGMQYENWFVPGNADWGTTEAVPLLGKYSSLDAAVLRKHFEWFEWLGVDWLLIDWSNML